MIEGTNAIPELDDDGLRSFGLVFAGAIALVFGALLPFLLETAIPYWPFLLALVLFAWSIVVPRSLKIIYRPWMKFGIALNRITTPIIMGAVFFLLITPVSLLMKLIGRDPLDRGFDPHAQSYRKQSQKAPRKSLERPF